MADWLDRIDVVLWWPNIIYACGNISEVPRCALTAELRKRLAAPNEWVQLSAVFGLALLNAEDIGDVAGAAMTAQPAWSQNAELIKRLERLRNGSKSYPSFSHEL